MFFVNEQDIFWLQVAMYDIAIVLEVVLRC